MTKTKKAFSVIGIILAVALISISVYAASAYSTPAEALAGLTGKTVDEVIALRQESGERYCDIAAEAGKLDEFRAAVLEMKKEIINQRVEEGRLTQERAGELIQRMENCDGTGQAKLGQEFGIRYQNNKGTGMGTGNGWRAGNSMGRGMNP